MCEENTSECPLQVRELILNARQPIILRNFKTSWTCFGGMEEWCKKLGTANFDFECMQKTDCQTPQWERKRKIEQMNVKEFLKNHTNREDCWLGLNYKRAQELPAECKKDIDFSCFGFTQANDDYSFWLSSAGANTPCHYDTYGCNIVVQIFGKKSWLLFPPASDLTSTRIPYEESSVYCIENFYAPNMKEIEKCQQLSSPAYHCILEPNDVLIVPRHWWHYVEAIETSLSVNAWIPLENDADEQMNECIVKFLIESMVKGINSSSIKEYILNPNQLEQIADNTELFAVMEYLIKTQETKDLSKKATGQFAYQYLSEQQFNVIFKKITKASKVNPLSKKEFIEFLKKNAKRSSANSENDSILEPLNKIQEILINSICSSNVVQHIKTEFYKRYKNDR